jgi:putative spermidine/putrescine transport system substrate-binding protein
VRSKRRYLGICVLAVPLVATLVWVATATAGPKSKGSFVAVTGGGSYGQMWENYGKAFTKATGIHIKWVLGMNNPIPPLQAQERSGNVQWDLTFCSRQVLAGFSSLYQNLNHHIVKFKGMVTSNGIEAKRALLDLEGYPVMMYSKKAYPGKSHPTSWKDFYNFTKFPGNRAVLNFGLDSAWFVPATALLASGVSPAHLEPFNLTTAYNQMATLRPHIKVFATGYAQEDDLLRSGEITMDTSTDGRALQLIKTDPKAYGLIWNQAFVYQDSFCIPKKAPDATNANKFIEFVLTHPKLQVKATKLTFYGPPTKAGVRMALKAGVKDFSSLHVKHMIADSNKLTHYIQANSQELLAKWNAYVQGG